MYDNPFDGQPENEVGDAIPEAQKILQGLLGELPNRARWHVEKLSQELTRLDDQSAETSAHIRDEAEQRVAENEHKAEERRTTLVQQAIEQLEPLQKDLIRAGEIGAALATFVQIQALKARMANVLPNPGNLLNFAQVGKSFHFRIVGDDRGPVWGSDVYTSDSHLAAAAVHAGALEMGEEGVVRVSMVSMAGMPIKGSMRHGVMSMDWGHYQVGYRITKA
ncbi:MAG: hypothetical protein EXS16_03215 [Gemmataceae bacterium]|nr:hypothetical protein [Gemmataceae bacterium]